MDPGDIIFIVHDKNDFPDADTIHGVYKPGRNESIEVKMRNIQFSKKSTKSSPCQRHWPKSCHEIYMQKEIAEKYQCHVPILFNFTGVHEINVTQFPACNHTSTVEIMNSKVEIVEIFKTYQTYFLMRRASFQTPS